MATITLEDMMTDVRNRTDQQNSDFISDPELVTYVNDGYSDLYDLCVSKDIYFFSSGSFTVPSNQSSFDKPADHYETKGLDVVVGSQPWTVDRCNWKDRNQRFVYGLTAYNYPQVKVQYYETADQIRLIPDIAAAGTYTLYYYPSFVPLVEFTDPVVPLFANNGWWEYAVIDACIKVREKAEQGLGSFPAKLQDLKSRILRQATKRNVDQPVVLDYNRGRSGNYDPIGYGIGSWRR